MRRAFWRWSRMLPLFVCLALRSHGATATDIAFTGFGTAAFAISDEAFRYLRYIDEGGTFKADSLVGFQAEAAFSPQWSATLQAVASAPRTRDEGYEAKIRWAFVSFRPNNDWLFRAGRLRPPVLIHTQNAEVGVTYDQARLPEEVYSLSPVYDTDGGAVTKTWTLQDFEVNADAYWGRTEIKYRLPFQREPAARTLPQLAGFIPSGNYVSERVAFMGLVLSYSAAPLLLRGGVHHARIKLGHQFPESYAPATFAGPPPFGGTLWLPQTLVDKVSVTGVTFGADWRPGHWRVSAEYGQRIGHDTKLGNDSKSAYVTLARSIGSWTPYVTHARLRSDSDPRTRYEEVNATPVPLAAQALGFPAEFHRILADAILMFDQYSNVLGASYSFSATSKLKAEWMQTKVGLRSSLVDGDVRDRRFNVFTLAYAFAF